MANLLGMAIVGFGAVLVIGAIAFLVVIGAIAFLVNVILYG